jgi:hypothetical protein
MAGMAPGDIMCPQLGGSDRLGGAWQDGGLRLDQNASLEPPPLQYRQALHARGDCTQSDKFVRKKMDMRITFNPKLRLAQRQLDLYVVCE